MADYPKPSLTTDAVVLAGQGSRMALLLIRRDRAPFEGGLALPGGFLDPYERPLRACLRELREETGLALTAQAAALSLRTKRGRDPRGWTVSQPFVFHLPEPLAVRAGDDAREAFWQPLAELDRLAFDHGAILCEALGRFWNPMPGAAAHLKPIRCFGEPAAYSRCYTFYGGSFNPWHRGHLQCILECPSDSRVIVVPDGNPFKAPGERACYWHAYRRIQDCVASAEAVVFPGFFGIEGPNPTVTWFPWVDAQQRGLLMGDDSFASLPDWIRAETLIAAADHLYVVPRDASTSALDRSRQWLSRTNPSCRLRFLPDHPFRDLSSSSMRRG